MHRLLQNKVDGKLVPTEGPPSEAECAQEKVDSVQLEFTYLLTSQLEEQRIYFEDRLALLENQFSNETKRLKDELNMVREENKHLKSKLNNVTKDKQACEKKLAQQNLRLNQTLNDLNEERQLGKAMRNNQQLWQSQVAELDKKFVDLKEAKEKQLAELNEQVRDLMFFIDAQQVINKSENKEDIAGGTVTIGEAPQPETSKKNRKKRNKK